MRKLSPILFSLFVAFNAHAAHRTFVAASGTDTGTCGPTAQCRTLDYAMSQTDSGGEVVITESGGYGSSPSGGITITKSLSIIAQPGIFAALAPTTGYNGVTIATAGVNVVLKGLNINGRGGTNGIHMTNGDSLTVLDSNLSDFGYVGITWPGESGGAAIYINTPAKVTVTNTVVRYNGFGIRIAGGAQVMVSHVQAIMNGLGIGAVGPAADTSTTTSLTISDSLATLGYIGFAAYGQVYCGSCSTVAHISNSASSNNSYGIVSGYPGAKVFASSNSIEKNSSGMRQEVSATFNSAGNNVTLNNNTNTSGAITSVSGSVFN